MDVLGGLKNDLRQLKNQRDSINGEINNLNKRRKDVEEVIASLKNTVASNVEDSNKKIHALVDKLSNIKYSGKEAQINSIFSGKEEPSIGVDYRLSYTHNELRRELNDINERLSELHNNLAEAKRNVESAETAVSDESKR